VAQYTLFDSDDLALTGKVKPAGGIAAGHWHRERLQWHQTASCGAEGATAPETLRQKDRCQFDL
jgi:hypothetical protein